MLLGWLRGGGGCIPLICQNESGERAVVVLPAEKEGRPYPLRRQKSPAGVEDINLTEDDEPSEELRVVHHGVRSTTTSGCLVEAEDETQRQQQLSSSSSSSEEEEELRVVAHPRSSSSLGPADLKGLEAKIDEGTRVDLGLARELVALLHTDKDDDAPYDMFVCKGKQLARFREVYSLVAKARSMLKCDSKVVALSSLWLQKLGHAFNGRTGKRLILVSLLVAHKTLNNTGKEAQTKCRVLLKGGGGVVSHAQLAYLEACLVDFLGDDYVQDTLPLLKDTLEKLASPSLVRTTLDTIIVNKAAAAAEENNAKKTPQPQRRRRKHYSNTTAPPDDSTIRTALANIQRAALNTRNNTQRTFVRSFRPPL